MEGDLHNLVPAVGQINADRSDFRFGAVRGEAQEYGACDFETDRVARVAEVADDLKGDVARAYLYMHFTYSTRFPLSNVQIERLLAWHTADAPDFWERRRNAWIAAVQGNRNPLVER